MKLLLNISLKLEERHFAGFAVAGTISSVASQELGLQITFVVRAHHVSKLGADGGGGVEDHVDDLPEKPVVVVWSGRHLADGPLEAVVTRIHPRQLSNVLGQPFEEGVPVLEGAALELPTRGGGTAKGEREGKRETECGADVRKRDGQGGADPQDERSLRIERSLDLSIDIVPDWCVVRGVVVVGVVSKDKGGEYGE